MYWTKTNIFMLLVLFLIAYGLHSAVIYIKLYIETQRLRKEKREQYTSNTQPGCRISPTTSVHTDDRTHILHRGRDHIIAPLVQWCDNNN